MAAASGSTSTDHYCNGNKRLNRIQLYITMGTVFFVMAALCDGGPESVFVYTFEMLVQKYLKLTLHNNYSFTELCCDKCIVSDTERRSANVFHESYKRSAVHKCLM